jgi:hypothetical protein
MCSPAVWPDPAQRGLLLGRSSSCSSQFPCTQTHATACFQLEAAVPAKRHRPLTLAFDSIDKRDVRGVACKVPRSPSWQGSMSVHGGGQALAGHVEATLHCITYEPARTSTAAINLKYLGHQISVSMRGARCPELRCGRGRHEIKSVRAADAAPGRRAPPAQLQQGGAFKKRTAMKIYFWIFQSNHTRSMAI